MKKSLLIIIHLALSFHLFSQADFSLVGGKIQLSGTSTLHDWTAETTKSAGTASIALNGSELSTIKSLAFSMDAKSIKSAKGSTMDKNMYKALKAEQNPKITFSLEKVKSISPKGNGYEVKADGKLTIAGTTKSISMVATGQVKGNEIVFKGSQQLKMTDFNIEPPVMMLGTLKTANEVTITYEATYSTTGISMK